MSFIAGSISGTISLDESTGVAAMRNTVKEAQNMKVGVDKATVEASAAGTKNFKGMIAGISSEFGKRSNLGLGLKLLAGGGAIAGVSLAAHQFEALAADTSKMTDEFRRGDVGVQELAGNILRNVPILGSFAKGFDEIGAAISGERVELEKQNAETKKMNDEIDHWQAMRGAAVNAVKDVTESLTKMRAEYAANNAQEPFKAILLSAEEARQKINGVREEFVKLAATAGVGLKNFDDFPKELTDATSKIEDFETAYKQAAIRLQSSEGAFAPFAGIDEKELDAMADDVEEYGEGLRKIVDEHRAAVTGFAAAQQNLAKERKTRGELKQVAPAFDNSVSEVGITLATQFNAANVPLREFYRGWGELIQKSHAEQDRALFEMQDHLKEVGKSLTESLRTPWEEIRDSVKAADTLLAQNKISPETHQRELNSARDALLDITAPSTARIQAEEVGGHTTVTAQDQGGGGQRMAADQLKEQQATTDGINKLIEMAKQQQTFPKFTVVTLP